MSLIKNKAYKFKGTNAKLITADLTYALYKQPVPICIFVHGFKGFKDWGAWPLAAEIFAIKNVPFFKFNFSHNGTTPNKLTEFTDLEAFGENNFKIEYDELGLVIDFIENKKEAFEFNWNGEINVIGHSRGGGIALLRAAQDKRISKVITWAGVGNFDKYIHLKDLIEWKNDNVHFIINGRTNQKMPMYLQFVEAYVDNKSILDLDENMEKITCPTLIVHGDSDNVIPLAEAQEIYTEISHSILIEIEGADHTFNIKHPLTERKITKQFAKAINETIDFFDL